MAFKMKGYSAFTKLDDRAKPMEEGVRGTTKEPIKKSKLETEKKNDGVFYLNDEGAGEGVRYKIEDRWVTKEENDRYNETGRLPQGFYDRPTVPREGPN